MTSEKKSFNGLLFTLLIVILTSSCSLTRDVQEDEYLLNKVVVKVDNRNLKAPLNSLVRQKENRRILWTYRFKLRFYSSFLFKKESQKPIRKSIGEPPVIFDSTSADRSTLQIHKYLLNKGYYENKVSFKTITKKKSKKLKIVYTIDPNKPIELGSIKIDTGLTTISKALMKDGDKSLLKVGDNFDLDVLQAERKRLTRLMQNEGYFFFTEDLIYYNVDTLTEKRKAFVTYKIQENPTKIFGDSTKVDPYITYKIRDVYVRQDFGKKISQIAPGDTAGIWGYKFLNESQFNVKPKVISRSIFHHSKEFYTLENHESTYRRLTSLNNFKYVNISYRTAADSLPNYLDCIVSLSPSKPASVSFEFNVTNTGGIPGINGTFSIFHRNIFKGAELLKFSLYGGLEAQFVRSSEEILDNTALNTVEIGPELSLVLPKFLLPVDQNRFAKRFIPKTTIAASYNYQRRPDYTRNIISTGLIYSWKESKTKSHSIQPINISQIKIFKSDDFAKRLDTLNNSSLKASYEDNFITSIMYNFVYNGQVINKDKTFQIFRANLEFAGNAISSLQDNVLNLEQDTGGAFLINGIPYAQFFRTYVEYVPHIVLNKANSFVMHTFIGVGVPYGNSISMPFVRAFYGGGTNGIRAWQARTLGPGSISNEDLKQANVDQIGDIKIEQSFEYRFKIIRFLEGAAFADMGNIWYLDNPEYSESGNFKFNTLWKDIAIGTGLGVRLNFDYFVVRLDYAQRIKDPGAANPYSIRKYSGTQVLNFAIGYPF